MEYILLKDIAVITMGQSPDSSTYNQEKQGLPFYQGNADFGEIIPTTRIWCNSPKKVAKQNDILISVRAPIGSLNYANEVCCIGRGLAAISIEDDIDRKFIYYFLKAKNRELNNQGTGSTFKAIGKSVLEELKIPTISKEKKLNSMKLMDSVERNIKLKKQELKMLDDLIKARFVEMFGDPISNTQNRPTTELINVVKMQRGFDLPVQDRQQDGNIPVFGSNGALDHHNVAKVKGGGVITGRSGTIGNVYYTDGDYWPLNTSLFSIDTHGNNVVYLAYLLTMYDLSRFTEGTGVPTLNRNKFHNKPIIDVSLDEQIQFANFVKQVDKSKLAVQHSLEKTQQLFDSLMQEYFG